MMKKDTYYTLRVHGDTGYFKTGDEFCASSEPLIVGETPDCNIRYHNDSGLVPQYYAAILPDDDGETWRIIPLSDFVKVELSGHGPVETVCSLKSGDTISFTGQKATLQYRVQHDSAYHDPGRVIVKRSDTRVIVGLAAAFLVLLIAGGFWLHSSMKQITRDELTAYESSVYQIQVDSVDCVRYVHGSPDEIIWRENFADGHHEVGSAFLTDGGELITARHCVEYWLGRDPDLQSSICDLDPEDITRRIAEAETYNFTNPDTDTLYVVRSHCHAYNDTDPEGIRFVSNGPNVSINRERDDILVYDDFDTRHYWRSITPHFLRHDMALGDIVRVQVPQKGSIALAAPESIEKIANGTETALLGYPESGIDTRVLDFAKGSYHKALSEQSGMIVTKGEATHGFSGGPVFVRQGSGFAVVGVLSKVDPVNGEIKYSVPINK